jgi:hypothetical protein
MANHCDDCHLSEAPWTAEEVVNLCMWQSDPRVHPFTGLDGDFLVPTRDGWANAITGEIVQTWAHTFMVDGSHLAALNASPIFSQMAGRTKREGQDRG